jgi:hypothetical protein
MVNLAEAQSGTDAVESGIMEVGAFLLMLSISMFGAHLSLSFHAASSSFVLASQIAAFS